jgi:uncharacterized protein involved in exopolysaccharide biosynthesis
VSVQSPQAPEVRGYFVQVPLPHPEDRVDLRAAWRHVVRYRLMIALFVLIPMLLAAVAVSLMRPVYEAEVVVVPAATEDSASGLSSLTSQLGGLAAIVGIGTPAGSDKEQTIAILQSRAFTEAFIKSENLMPVLFAQKWDSAAKKWKPSWWRRTPTLSDAVELFDEEIRALTDDTSTTLITMQIQWFDPQLAARWANILIRRLNDDVRKRDIAEARRSVEFISRELKTSDNLELRQGMYALMQQQLERIVMANVRQDYALRVLSPALAADPHDYVWPKKIAIVGACGLLGLIFATVAVALRVSWQSPRRG